MEDARNGAHYVCAVNNNELRNIVQGDDQKVIPRRITGDDIDSILAGSTLLRPCSSKEWGGGNRFPTFLTDGVNADYLPHFSAGACYNLT